MARWTVDRWASTLHRVAAESGQPARQSLAFFHQPDHPVGYGMPQWFMGVMLWLAKRLVPFGTGVGGMVVAVTVHYPEGWRRRAWHMIVRDGAGPFIPAAVLLRDPGAVSPGARPAVAEVPLVAITTGMTDLAVEAAHVTEDVTLLFVDYLRADLMTLSLTVQAVHKVHGPRHWSGRANVTRGTHLWSRLIAALFGFPPASDDVPVTVTMTPQNGSVALVTGRSGHF